MKSIGVFVDVGNQYHNIYKKFGEKQKISYKKYLDKAVGSDNLYCAFAYGMFRNFLPDKFIECLKFFGYETKYKPLNRFGWEVGIAMDVVRHIGKLDIVVLGYSGPAIIPLVDWIGEQGVKCVIFGSCIHKDLKDSVYQWWEIDNRILEEPKEDLYDTMDDNEIDDEDSETT
jgi:hypothetical protein